MAKRTPCVRDCRGNPFVRVRNKRLERKARPGGERPKYLRISVREMLNRTQVNTFALLNALKKLRIQKIIVSLPRI